MKKYIHVIIYVVLFLACFIVGQFNLLGSNKTNSEKQNEEVSNEQKPSDLVLEETIKIKIGEENFDHLDDSVSLATLSNVVLEDEDSENPYEDIYSFVFSVEDESTIELFFDDLGVISVEVEENAVDEERPEVKLNFRTGGKVTLQEGENVKLYETESGNSTIDQRKHKNFEYNVVEAKITDIKFQQISLAEDEIYAEYMVLENSNGEEIILEFAHMNLEELTSDGNIIAEYNETIGITNMFELSVDEDFKLKATFDDGTSAIYKIGDTIEVVNNYNESYWELYQETVISKYNAQVKDFVFGHDNQSITSLDYIVFSIPDHDDVKMTFVETEAEYAKPVGNYIKIYNHLLGEEQVLVDVRADEDWVLILDYNEVDVLELAYGTEIKIYQDNLGIWRIDRAKEEEEIL